LKKFSLIFYNINAFNLQPVSFLLLFCWSRKKDGNWHLCVGYHKLNDLTIKNIFSISIIDDSLDELKNAKYYSKIDLRSGYHQIRMHPQAIPLTTFRTH
jgi:hypothetical protein